MTGRARAAVISLTTAGALAASLAPNASGSFYVDHAFVPGIGRVGTTLPTDTEVRPPGYIPPAPAATAEEYERQEKREARVADRVEPGRDIGPQTQVKKIKRDVSRELFLYWAALTCQPYPKAGLWVFQYIFAKPGRRPYKSRYESNRKDSLDEEPRCTPTKLKFVRWQGVRIRDGGKRADVMVRGREFEDEGADGSWFSYRVVWQLAVRRVDDRWRITVYTHAFPDINPD